MCGRDSNKKWYKRHFSLCSQQAINFCSSSLTSAAFTGVGSIPSTVCLPEPLTADSRFLTSRGWKDIIIGENRSESSGCALPVGCCWHHMVDQWQNLAMRASLSSPGLGMQSALFLYVAFTAAQVKWAWFLCKWWDWHFTESPVQIVCYFTNTTQPHTCSPWQCCHSQVCISLTQNHTERLELGGTSGDHIVRPHHPPPRIHSWTGKEGKRSMSS